MNNFLNLLITYWKPIVGLVFAIVGFIFCLIKKRPVQSILEDIYNLCIKAISEVESSEVVGSFQKLSVAVELVSAWLCAKYPDIDFNLYRSLVIETIEKILSTPQKKK